MPAGSDDTPCRPFDRLRAGSGRGEESSEPAALRVAHNDSPGAEWADIKGQDGGQRMAGPVYCSWFSGSVSDDFCGDLRGLVSPSRVWRVCGGKTCRSRAASSARCSAIYRASPFRTSLRPASVIS